MCCSTKTPRHYYELSAILQKAALGMSSANSPRLRCHSKIGCNCLCPEDPITPPPRRGRIIIQDCQRITGLSPVTVSAVTVLLLSSCFCCHRASAVAVLLLSSCFCCHPVSVLSAFLLLYQSHNPQDRKSVV